MKKWTIVLSLCLLTGCSAGGIKSVDDLYEDPVVVEETISKDVIVHTVVGEAPGEVVLADEKNKWIAVDLAAVSQHPQSLVEVSNGRTYKAELVAYDEATEIAYIKMKSSLKLDETLPEAELNLEQNITYEDRLRLKEKYAVEGEPSAEIEAFDELVFTENPDEVEAFIWQFEQASDKEAYIANDLLIATLAEAFETDYRYTLTEIEAVAVGKTAITVVGAIDITDAAGDETKGQITYSVTKVDGDYRIINIQLSA